MKEKLEDLLLGVAIVKLNEEYKNSPLYGKKPFSQYVKIQHPYFYERFKEYEKELCEEKTK